MMQLSRQLPRQNRERKLMLFYLIGRQEGCEWLRLFAYQGLIVLKILCYSQNRTSLRPRR